VLPHLLFWHWWIAAVVLAIAEVLLPGAFFIWLALAAAVTGVIVAAVPDIGIEYQGLVFSLLSVIAWVFGRRFVRRHLAATDNPALNRRAEQYVGRRFTLSEPIVNGVGRSRVGDGVWTVEGDEDLAVGTTVKVVGVNGARLKVEKAA
jgi:membrane protein implicated in regulation of membrane protease activity